MSLEYGWGREVFSFAIALQNLMWGALGALAGGFADRYGPGRVVAAGAICYILGLIGLAYIDIPWLLHLNSAVLLGGALGGTSFGIILAVIGRTVAPERRSLAMGLATSAGSFGQFLLLPITQTLIARLRLARRAPRPRGDRRAHHPAVAGAGRRPGRRRAEAAVDRRSAARGDAREGLPPAVLGLLRLRLPHRDADRALAGLRDRRRPQAVPRHDRARADRPVQRHRHARRGLPRRSLQQEVPALRHLHHPRLCSSPCWCSCR